MARAPPALTATHLRKLVGKTRRKGYFLQTAAARADLGRGDLPWEDVRRPAPREPGKRRRWTHAAWARVLFSWLRLID